MSICLQYQVFPGGHPSNFQALMRLNYYLTTTDLVDYNNLHQDVYSIGYFQLINYPCTDDIQLLIIHYCLGKLYNLSYTYSTLWSNIHVLTRLNYYKILHYMVDNKPIPRCLRQPHILRWSSIQVLARFNYNLSTPAFIDYTSLYQNVGILCFQVIAHPSTDQIQSLFILY